MKKKSIQRVICCPCGREKILALGLCATCNTLERQDEVYFGVIGRRLLREMAISTEFLVKHASNVASGHWRCTIRVRGNNNRDLMITLCLGHHAMATRTQMLRKGIAGAALGSMARPASRRARGRKHRVTMQGCDEGRHVLEAFGRGPDPPRRQIRWLYQPR
jgi:hypothetical protein